MGRNVEAKYSVFLASQEEIGPDWCWPKFKPPAVVAELVFLS